MHPPDGPRNAKADAKRLGPGIPKSDFWASAGEGIDQVGCVYTAQGFEFDYVGVISDDADASSSLEWRVRVVFLDGMMRDTQCLSISDGGTPCESESFAWLEDGRRPS